jgi:hypothetical protein
MIFTFLVLDNIATSIKYEVDEPLAMGIKVDELYIRHLKSIERYLWLAEGFLLTNIIVIVTNHRLERRRLTSHFKLTLQLRLQKSLKCREI